MSTSNPPEEDVTRVAERFLREPSSGIGDLEPDPRGPELLLTAYALLMREFEKIAGPPPVVEASKGIYLTLVLHRAVCAARRAYADEFTEQDEALLGEFSVLHRAASHVGGVHNAVAIHRDVFRRLREICQRRCGGRLSPAVRACFPDQPATS